MKKITLLFSLLTLTFFNGFAQLNVSVSNADGTGWNPYVNAFNTSDESFAFGFGYAFDKQKTEFDGTTVTVKPNYGIWTDENNNAAWFDNPGTPPSNPNKNIEALSYLQVSKGANPEFFTQDVTFSGDVNAFTIDGSYVVKAFIAVFPGDYSSSVRYETIVTGTGTFSVTRPFTDVVPADTHFQYGFIVYGLPADPALEASLGSVVFQQSALSSEEFAQSNFTTYPNPTSDNWIVKTSNLEITNIRVYDILGKNVITMAPKTFEASIDGSGLKTGLYFAQIETPAGIGTIKLVKN
ncbi:T9SS type A sorting domain-containing protein [Gaetbulibacter sp. M240]|uniref:T9SS type A sorting domain-containing protein n=1 Tax=Gaetbulibacter sp. M240 TaxID=3126511 RepID=UPI00374F5E72